MWAHVRWRSKSKVCPFLLAGLAIPGLRREDAWKLVFDCHGGRRVDVWKAWPGEGRELVCMSILGLPRGCFLTWAETQAPITLTPQPVFAPITIMAPPHSVWGGGAPMMGITCSVFLQGKPRLYLQGTSLMQGPCSYSLKDCPFLCHPTGHLVLGCLPPAIVCVCHCDMAAPQGDLFALFSGCP